MFVPSKTIAPALSGMVTVDTTLPSLARSLVMELPETQMLAPSKTRAPAPVVSETVFKTCPSLALTLETMLGPAIHMLEPSNARAPGEVPAGIVALA